MSPPLASAARVRALLAFFRATQYDVEMPDVGFVALRTGEIPEPAVADWLGDDGFGVYMTSCNPFSQALIESENARRLAALRADLSRLGARFLEGAGYVPGERWREPSFLVCGLDLGGVDRLARTYEQNCVLIVEPGRTVRLRLYRADWRGLADEAPDLEWAPDAR